jgi:hypothetical protein
MDGDNIHILHDCGAMLTPVSSNGSQNIRREAGTIPPTCCVFLAAAPAITFVSPQGGLICESLATSKGCIQWQVFGSIISQRLHMLRLFIGLRGLRSGYDLHICSTERMDLASICKLEYATYAELGFDRKGSLHICLHLHPMCIARLVHIRTCGWLVNHCQIVCCWRLCMTGT